MLRIFAFLLFACGGLTNLIAQEKDQDLPQIKVNAVYNSDYTLSTGLTTGRMDSLEIISFHKALQYNLKVTTSPIKTLIIGYMQNGHNCLSITSSTTYLKTVQERYFKSTQKVAKKYDAENYMVYASNSFVSNYPCVECIEDKGFLKRFVFTSNQNCMGFFILKGDGQFYKYYGEDYVSIIDEVLSGKLNN